LVDRNGPFRRNLAARTRPGEGPVSTPWQTFIAFELAPISAVLGAEDLVHRVAADRASVDERHWPKPIPGGSRSGYFDL
jgi:hypothetical protein